MWLQLAFNRSLRFLVSSQKMMMMMVLTWRDLAGLRPHPDVCGIRGEAEPRPCWFVAFLCLFDAP